MKMHYVIAAALLLIPSVSLASAVDGPTITKAVAHSGYMTLAQLKPGTLTPIPPGTKAPPKKTPPPPPPPMPAKKKP